MKAVTCFVVFVVFQSAMVKSAEIKRAMPKKSAVKDAVAKNVAVSAATNEVKKCPKVLNKIPVDPKFNINEVRFFICMYGQLINKIYFFRVFGIEFLSCKLKLTFFICYACII